MNTNKRLILPTKLNPNKSTIYTNLIEKLLKVNLIFDRAKTKESRITNEKRQNDPEKGKLTDISKETLMLPFKYTTETENIGL